uniref:Uncharacterized protein n=1 Tax=Timema shepardi TaxID=629360 RepID=A0A7R9ATK0_TIMSH|nr:unnamed protein product [Timema shepardi]
MRLFSYYSREVTDVEVSDTTGDFFVVIPKEVYHLIPELAKKNYGELVAERITNGFASLLGTHAQETKFNHYINSTTNTNSLRIDPKPLPPVATTQRQPPVDDPDLITNEYVDQLCDYINTHLLGGRYPDVIIADLSALIQDGDDQYDITLGNGRATNVSKMVRESNVLRYQDDIQQYQVEFDTAIVYEYDASVEKGEDLKEGSVRIVVSDMWVGADIFVEKLEKGYLSEVDNVVFIKSETLSVSVNIDLKDSIIFEIHEAVERNHVEYNSANLLRGVKSYLSDALKNVPIKNKIPNVN